LVGVSSMQDSFRGVGRFVRKSGIESAWLGSVPRDQNYSLCDYLMHCFIFVGIGNMTGGDTGTSPLSNLEGFHMSLLVRADASG
jgi:hypothetical protein